MKKFKTTALAAFIVLTLCTVVFAADTTAGVAIKPSAKAKMVDINTASEEQLKARLGIGSELAEKIIAGRPYHQKGELKTKSIVTTDQYEKINKLIKALC